MSQDGESKAVAGNKVKEQREIPRELDNLHENIDRLASSLSTFFDRLTPVISQVPEGSDEAVSDRSTDTAMAATIVNASRKVARLIDAVESNNGRTQL